MPFVDAMNKVRYLFPKENNQEAGGTCRKKYQIKNLEHDKWLSLWYIGYSDTPAKYYSK